jgi:uncharacterized protein
VIVCDAGPLVAAAIKNDARHRDCVDLFTALHLAERWILVPGTVAAEVGYLLAREGGPAVEAQFLSSLADGTLWPVELTREDYQRPPISCRPTRTCRWAPPTPQCSPSASAST